LWLPNNGIRRHSFYWSYLVNSCSRLTGPWVEKTLVQTLVCQFSSTVMELLFSFDVGVRVEKTLYANSRFSTLIQTLASQLSSCNSHANSRFSTLVRLAQVAR
jgi:hypothetical protein